MKQRSFLLSLVIIISIGTFSQERTQDFTLFIPTQKVQNSLYNSIHFIDSRQDSSAMGIVQNGVFNKKVRVVTRIPLAEQFRILLDSLKDASAKEGELVFQLRHFSFVEITGAFNEKGYCYLKAELYAKKGGRYLKLNSLDSVVYVKSGEVTKKLMKNTRELIFDFISKSLLVEPAEGVYYSYSDIMNIDRIEKRKLKLYTTSEYTDGLYLSYESFKNQLPDMEAIVIMNDKKVRAVNIINNKGKTEKVDTKSVYAVVHNGQLHIATQYGFYQLRKVKDDFLFYGKGKVTAEAIDVISAQFYHGLIGSMLAADKVSILEMKIDHVNGGFIRLRDMRIHPRVTLGKNNPYW